jgi:hypothetical protein
MVEAEQLFSILSKFRRNVRAAYSVYFSLDE